MKPLPFREVKRKLKQPALSKWRSQAVTSSLPRRPRPEQGRLQFQSIAKLRLALFEAFFGRQGSASKTSKNFDTLIDKLVWLAT